MLSLVVAASFATWLVVRQRFDLAGGWTDGRTTYSSLGRAGLRYAVWDDPRPLPGEVNSEATESRPALSPDGRLLVFVAGERGLNADLWVAELENGEPREPRPLASLNTPSDELAPAFGPEGLYFATDRAGREFGLDLWRATYSEGGFGEPVPIGSGINTLADETDPFPIPGTPELVFSSNRPRGERGDYDLYHASPDPAAGGPGVFLVAPLDALNTPSDEREPALTADGRTMVFASDRSGSRGGFDLWRSYEEALGWLPPEPLDDLNTELTERAPLPSQDGFALLFEAESEPGLPSDLWRARSLELFRVPGPPVAWKELVLVALFLASALLTWLAKHWRGLEIIHKCFLISLIVHLGVMWYMGGVYTDPGALAGPGDDGLFRVHFVPSRRGQAGGLREHGGELAGGGRDGRDARGGRDGGAASDGGLARASSPASGPARASPGAPGALERARPRAEDAGPAGPERRDVDLGGGRGRAAASGIELQEREAAYARLSASAPGLGLSSQPSSTAPERGGTGPGTRGAPRSWTLEAAAGLARPQDPGGAGQRGTGRFVAARAAGDDGVGAPAPAVLERDGAAGSALLGGGGTGTEVQQPQESFEALGGAAPALALPGAGTSAQPSRAVQGLARGAGGSGAGGSGPGGTGSGASGDGGPSATPGALGELGTVANADALPATRRGPGVSRAEGAGSGGGGGGGGPEVAVRDVAEDPSAPPGDGGGDAPAFDATGGLAGGGAGLGSPEGRTRDGGPGAEPRRFRGESAGTGAGSSGDGAGVEGDAARPSAHAFGELGTGIGEEPLPTVTRGPALTRGGDGAGGLAEGGGPEVAVRDVAEGALGPPGEGAGAGGGAATFDAMAGLGGGGPANAGGRSGSGTGDGDGLGAPRRFRHEADRDVAAGPARRALAAAPPLAAPLAPDRPQERLEQTPYKNRFGEEKLRALEEYGGGVETERAVALGLAYLAGIQHEDGGWGEGGDFHHEKYGDVRVGKSALALLAFLGAGHTPGSGTEHAAVAERAINYLLTMQDPGSGHFGDTSSYDHGIATYALAECFALTKDVRLEGPLKYALGQVLQNQETQRDPRFFGGWGYYFRDGRVWNGDRWPRVSVTSWQVMALESARLGGLEVPDEAFDNALSFLIATWDPRRGAFRYTHDPERLNSGYPILPASTPAAIFALSLLGIDVSRPELEQARRYVLERAPSGYRYRGDDAFVFNAVGNEYFWYYGTLAMFRVGGADWERWNVAMKETLLPAQAEDGSWEPISVYARYAGDDDWERTYTTAIAVLTLEVYYRYFTPLLRVDSR